VGSPLVCLPGPLSDRGSGRSGGICLFPTPLPLLKNLHERVQDDPHRPEQQPQNQHREPTGEDDVVERPGAVVLREGVDLGAEPGKGEEHPRDPEEDQRPAEADQPDNVHQHPDAVGDRVLARGPLDVVADLDRHLGDLQAVVADLDQDLGARAHPLAADVDRLDRPPPVGPKAALGVGDREVVPGKRGRGVEDLHPYFPVGGDLAGRALDEPGADDDVVALPELGKQPGECLPGCAGRRSR
jgi:hypothetical protein